MKNKFVIRDYEDSDFEEVWNLNNLALQDAGVHPGSGLWDEDLYKIRDVYFKNKGEFLVAEIDGEIIGMGALLRKNDEIAEIKKMRMHPKFQRKGIGKLLLDSLEKKAGGHGYKKLVLGTTVNQVAAQKLYIKNGYKETGRTKVGRFDCIIFEKRIE